MTLPFQTNPAAQPVAFSPFAAFDAVQPSTDSNGAPFLPDGDYALTVRIKSMVYSQAKAASPSAIQTELEVIAKLYGTTTESKDNIISIGSVLCERRDISTPVYMSYFVDMLLAVLGVKASDKQAVQGYQAYLKYFTEAATTGQPVTAHDGQTILPEMVIGKTLTVSCRRASKPSKGGHLIPFKTWSPA